MDATDLKKKEEGLVSWFKNQLLPELVQEGHFGAENSKSVVEKCEFEISERGIDHFASCPYFLSIILKNPEDGSRSDEYHVIVKFASQDPLYRIIMKTDQQFNNEMKMYNFVLPRFRKILSGTKRANLVDEICPCSYFARFDCKTPEKAVVILEDLRKSGFKVAPSKVDLDFDECAVALRQLARFHAISLAMKENAPGDLEQLKTSFGEVRFTNEPESKEFNNVFFGKCNQRGIDYLFSKDEREVPFDYLHAFKERVTKNPSELMMELVRPEEPLAVIAHGDFCRNNILFKHENGKVVAARLFDFQTYRYSSPSVDLSFFFYMNTTLELRERHFEDLFQIYHSTLTQTVSDILDAPLSRVLDKYPLRLFQEDFARVGVFGFVIASFFLPVMMAPVESAVDLEKEMMSKTIAESAEEIYSQGGEIVSRRIADIIVDFYRRKYYQL